MKNFIIDNDILKRVLKKTGLAIHPKPTLPVISNLHISVKDGQATFTATDTELTVLYTVECKASEAFDILLPYEFLSKIAALHGSIPMTFEVKANAAFIKGNNDVYEMKPGKLKDFPQMPLVPAENTIELNADIIDWLSRATATTSTDDQRAAMKKVCLDITPGIMKIVSTDSFVVFTHKHTVETQHTGKMLISTKIARALDGFASAKMSFNENHISFTGDGITVIATKHNEKYPNYKAVFADIPKSITLDRNLLKEALDKNSITNNRVKLSTIWLKQAAGKLVLEAQDDETKNKILAEVPAEYTGDVEKIVINARFLLTLLGQVSSYETINLHIAAEDKVMLVSADDDADYLSLITPYK